MAKSDISPDSLLKGGAAGEIRLLLVVETDPLADVRCAEQYAAIADKCEVIVIDSVLTRTARGARVAVPCLPHYQAAGTLVNYEGRAQRSTPLPIPTTVPSAARDVLDTICEKLGGTPADGNGLIDAFDLSGALALAVSESAPNSAGVLLRAEGKSAETAVAPRITKTVPRNTALRPWLVIHVFGSEELSALAPPIAELAPARYVELHPEDAAARGLAAGQRVDLTRDCTAWGHTVPIAGIVQLNPGLARGTVAVPLLLAPQSAVGEEEKR